MKYAYALAIITLLSALSISAVAAWYSIVGLTAIFAAAVKPIIIMGTTLEIGKIVATLWLHSNWHRAPKLMRAYLFSSVLLLMFITSMGIFGFLSKSHIEQTAIGQDNQAVILSLDSNINRSDNKILSLQKEIDSLNRGSSTRVDSLIENEQQNLNQLKETIRQEKYDIRNDAEKRINEQDVRLQQAGERKKADIESSENRFDVSDKTTRDIEKYDEEIAQAKQNELGVASRVQNQKTRIRTEEAAGLRRLDERYENSIVKSEERIQELRGTATLKVEDIDERIEEIEVSLSKEQQKINEWKSEKFELEAEYRKLEAEVGPIKYIAEFIYGEEADKNLLEAAVRWVIIIIVIVFDPLAIVLLLAATRQFEWIRNEKEATNDGSDDDNNEKLHNRASILKKNFTKRVQNIWNFQKKKKRQKPRKRKSRS